jgi:hypothetical protein
VKSKERGVHGSTEAQIRGNRQDNWLPPSEVSRIGPMRFVSGDPLLTANRVGIAIMAASAKLPTISNQREEC